MSNNWIQWFEIPAKNFERAKDFYEKIFAIDIEVRDFGSFKMGILPGKNTGALCYGEWYIPGEVGPLIYLNANPNLNDILGRVEEAGGKIISDKKQISKEMGFMALFYDSERNRIALKSDN